VQSGRCGCDETRVRRRENQDKLHGGRQKRDKKKENRKWKKDVFRLVKEIHRSVGMREWGRGEKEEVVDGVVAGGGSHPTKRKDKAISRRRVWEDEKRTMKGMQDVSGKPGVCALWLVRQRD